MRVPAKKTQRRDKLCSLMPGIKSRTVLLRGTVITRAPARHHGKVAEACGSRVTLTCSPNGARLSFCLLALTSAGAKKSPGGLSGIMQSVCCSKTFLPAAFKRHVCPRTWNKAAIIESDRIKKPNQELNVGCGVSADCVNYYVTRNNHETWENAVFFEDPTHNWVKNKQTEAGISYFSAVEKPVSVILVLQYDLLSATRGQFQGGNLQFAVFLPREILN